MIEYPKPITKQNIQRILSQMNNSFYKIKDINLICFFTKIKYKRIYIPAMITNYEIINYIKNNNSIDIFINNEINTIKFEKVKYFNKDNNLAIIQIKKNKKINYIELDEFLFEKEFDKYYNKKSIYIFNINNEKDITLSFSVIHDIYNSEIFFSCYFNKTYNYISPIFNLSNNKLISIYKYNYKFHKKGILLKFFISEFINAYKNFQIEKIEWNEIKILVNINKNDINTKIYFLDKENKNKKFEELNDTNTQLYINNIKNKYKNYFEPETEGEYNIKLKFNIELTDSSYMFAFCNKITQIDFIYFNTKYITSMKYMFHKCKNLKYINLLIFDTQNVIDMSDMFSFCENLNNLDLSSFNIKNVKNVSYMFYYCYNLTNLLSFSINNKNIVYTDYTFDMCNKLKISPYNIKSNKFINKYPNEINILVQVQKNDINKKIYFLYGLEELTELYINDKKSRNIKYFLPKKEGDYNINLKFNTVLTDCGNMFANCENIRYINFINFNSSHINNMRLMFSGCKNLKSLDLSSFSTNNVTSMSCMFSGCNNLISLDISSFDTKNVTNMSGMFSGCNMLKKIDLSSFNTKNVMSMSNMFSGCNNLNILDLSFFNTINVRDMSQMFDECYNLNNLDLSSFKTWNVINMSGMFYGCNNLNKINFSSSFDTQNVTNMASMFYCCYNLNNLDLSSFNTKRVINMSQMFYGCKNLINVNLSSFDTRRVINMSQMFYECNNLTRLDISKFNTNNVINMEQMFYNCPYVKYLEKKTNFLKNLSTKN